MEPAHQPSPRTATATAWLADYLAAAGGAAPSRAVKAAARQAGHGHTPLHAARERLGVTTERSGRETIWIHQPNPQEHRMTTTTHEARARATLRAVFAACREAGHVREGDTIPGVGLIDTLDRETPLGVEWHVIAAAGCAVARRIADTYHGGPSVLASLRTALTDSVAPPTGDDDAAVLAEIDEFQLADALRKTRLPVVSDAQRVADHDIGTVVVTIAEQPTGRERLLMAETLCEGRNVDTREVARQAVFLARTLASWAGPADRVLDEIQPLMLQPKENNR